METRERPPIQLIASLVIAAPNGEVLLVRYDPSSDRWWLPGGDLEPYEHPDEAARRVLAAFPGLAHGAITMCEVESFRGRRGWHVVFHYRAGVAHAAEPGGAAPAAWFPATALPRTMHGAWERDVVGRVLGA